MTSEHHVYDAQRGGLMRVWTLADIRHDLAEELAIIHRALRRNHRWSGPRGHEADHIALHTMAGVIIELGHNRYERPERLDRLHHGAYVGPRGGREAHQVTEPLPSLLHIRCEPERDFHVFVSDEFGDSKAVPIGLSCQCGARRWRSA